MIYSLRGTILEKTGGEVVIECGGVGYLLTVPGPVLGVLPAAGETSLLYTHMNVSENDVSLFGFATAEERAMFLLLTGVSGVGPKAGISILGALSPAQIALAASAGDFKAFTAASGVGPKLAQRLVLELKDKVAGTLGGGGLSLSDVAQAAGRAGAPAQASGQAVAALVALGYTQSEAAAAVAPLDPALPVAEMVRLALREIGKR